MQRIGLDMVGPICFAIGLGLCGGSLPAQAADCACGPLYCQDNSQFQPALQAKKDAMLHSGYPNRLVSLLDKGGQCLVCVGSGSPSIFTLLPVQPNGDNQGVPWDETNEQNAKTKLRSGEIASYYIYNARKACTCCGETKAEQRSDYDPDLELNRDTAIKCSKSGDDISCQ